MLLYFKLMPATSSKFDIGKWILTLQAYKLSHTIHWAERLRLDQCTHIKFPNSRTLNVIYC